MRTRWMRAEKLTTREQLVEDGKRRREARPICEIRLSGGVVVLRVRMPDGASEARPALDVRDWVQVLDARTDEQHDVAADPIRPSTAPCCVGAVQHELTCPRHPANRAQSSA